MSEAGLTENKAGVVFRFQNGADTNWSPMNSETTLCPHCAEVINTRDPEALFCKHCGTRLAEVPRTSAATIASSPAPRSAAPKRCPECGLYNPPEGTTCDCGFDFASSKVGRPIAGAQKRADATRMSDVSLGGTPQFWKPLVYMAVALLLCLFAAAKGQGSHIPTFTLVFAASRLLLYSLRRA